MSYRYFEGFEHTRGRRNPRNGADLPICSLDKRRRIESSIRALNRPGLIVKVEGSVSDDELRAAVSSLHPITDDEYANIPEDS